ncbi:MAG: hypothetical protein LBJ41_00895 [Treponema sp.]|jgi:hypothetical protein|nr:hypothetical protein [Treponema sp.]
MGYIPKKDVDFVIWVKGLIAYVQTHLTVFNIQDGIFQPILDLNTTWEAAYTKAIDPNKGTVDIANKNRAREALEKALRTFIKAFLLYSPFVSDNDRDKMRLPIHDTKPTPVPPPATFPEYDINTSVPSRLSVRFWDEATKQRGKPKGVHGAEIRWELRAEAPAKAEDLVNSEFSTRTPHTFVFTSDKQGQRVYFCLRWENSKGEKGPWGMLVSAVVP